MAAGTEIAPSAAPLARPRTLLVGTAFATGAAVMFFGALFALYFSVRNDTLAWGAEWFPEGAIELKPGGSLMSTYAMATITMMWAHYASRNEDRIHGYLALGLTALLVHHLTTSHHIEGVRCSGATLSLGLGLGLGLGLSMCLGMCLGLGLGLCLCLGLGLGLGLGLCLGLNLGLGLGL